MRFALPLLGTLVSCGLYAAAFRGGVFSALAWVALVPLLVAIRTTRLPVAFGLAALWGLLSGYGIAEPFPRSISGYFEQSPLVGWLLAVGIFTTMASPYYVLFVALDRRLAPTRGRAVGPWLVACAWLAIEWMRGRLFTETLFFIGNPWGLLGYSQLAALPLVQISEWTGVYGPSFLVALSNAFLADLALSRRTGAAGFARSFSLRAGLVAAPAALCLAYGVVVLRDAEIPSQGRVRVGAVQANLDLGVRWRREYYGRNLQRHMQLSVDLARAGRPAVIFWPEGSFTFFLEEEPAYQRAIGRHLTRLEAELIAGGPARDGIDGDGPVRFRNRVFGVEPGGHITGRYDKEHLVPFSEYVPGRAPDPMQRDFGVARSFSHGELVDPIPSRAGRVGILICNEALLSEVAAERVRAGAELLANPSNDSWVAEPDFARRMLEHVAFRSIELRRYMVRASTEGPSAIVDPYGRITAQTLHGEAGVVFGDVVPMQELTGYARFGDWFPAWVSAFALIALARPPRGSRSSGSGMPQA